jgi:chemotaxis receptor (MCP) glutamine deamidase CheD
MPMDRRAFLRWGGTSVVAATIGRFSLPALGEGEPAMEPDLSRAVQMQFMRPGQLDMINNALAPVTADGTVAGTGIWEVSLSQCEESDTDHAAKWETSNMMFFYPDLVDMSELGAEPFNLDMKPPFGIGGLDPREHASAEVGRRNVELAADAIGKEAQRLLASLPDGQRSFNIESISPENWWLI